MKKEIKLYNMILPPYLLMVFVPWLAAISIIGNFVIDSVVLCVISLIIYKRLDKKFYLSGIWKVWLWGFAGDFVGVMWLFIGSQIGYIYINTKTHDNGFWYQMMNAMNNVTNHSEVVNRYSYIFIATAILISAIAIFIFDYFISFRKTELSKKQKILSALSFAVFTAPYTFLLPNSLFYAT